MQINQWWIVQNWGFSYFANIKDEKQLRTYIPDTVHEIHQYDIQKMGN